MIQTKGNERLSLSDSIGTVLQDLGILDKKEEMVTLGIWIYLIYSRR